MTTATVKTPHELGTKLYQALRDLPSAHATGVSTGRVWHVPARNSAFIGRDELLAGLRQSLCARGVGVQALHGAGGVGKTTMAVEYAHRFGEHYEIVWWVPA